ncbi:AraC family transcriptional regulator [Pseudomonas sp. 2FE]|uniref:AraC family transcriptional regulator n=1 Tax=Pseudomonas sp. 2FE TaxID=2502190 RepID=UPI0010F5DE99|nr:AraC family transcriptional regulator [Pseudomonas sp. 2FE]
MQAASIIEFDFEWRPLHNYLKAQGIAPPALPQVAGEGTPQLPSETLYDWMVLNSRDATDGLRLGEHYRISDYGVAGLALLSAECVDDALKVVKTYMLLFNKDIAEIRIEQSTPDEVRIAIGLNSRPGWSEQARLFHANVLASASFKLFKDLLRDDFELLALTLPANPGDVRPYQEYFRQPVRFRGSGIVFHLPAQLLKTPIPTANPAVFQTALALAGESFNDLLEREMGGLKQRVVALLDSLPERYPDIRWTAQHLKMTERTLRRRLAEENCSYREIIDQARQARAQRLLANAQLSIEQIGALLGYADSSSFRHAFRRWTGQSANLYRQRHSGKP